MGDKPGILHFHIAIIPMLGFFIDVGLVLVRQRLLLYTFVLQGLALVRSQLYIDPLFASWD